MDTVTGAQVAVGLIVPVPRVRFWELVTAVDRIGEWSPEVTGGRRSDRWSDRWSDTGGPYAGARFIGHNRFPNGFESTVTCVVTEANRPSVFAWAVLDGAGQVGSTWRYDLTDGSEPGSTLVRHSFTHGPGVTGARIAAEADPRELDLRLVTLCRNMTTTITAMAADLTTGVTR
jgi:uncharacterized protein YndB with AHSA1/START domain